MMMNHQFKKYFLKSLKKIHLNTSKKKCIKIAQEFNNYIKEKMSRQTQYVKPMSLKNR